MTYREYMEANRHENFSWCKPYADDTETHFLIVYDGIASSISTPYITAHRYGGCDFEAELEALARDVNPDYDLYSGYNDQQIAMERMHEIGCWHCPFRDECETMGEEMDETDYR